jgi:hypothetical protein
MNHSYAGIRLDCGSFAIVGVKLDLIHQFDIPFFAAFLV